MVNPLKVLQQKLNGQSSCPAPPSMPWTNQNQAFAGFSIGRWTYGFPVVKNWQQNTKLVIGNYCSIAEGVVILLGGEHRTDWITTYPFAELLSPPALAPRIGASKGDVIIGHDVWIGMEAMLLSGITVGSGAVIGARSVVTKSVKPYSIVAGNPARHIKFRIPEERIQAMLKIAWWDWTDSQVLAAAPGLLSANLNEFIEAHQND
jgi:acetyltransferase-like isoleucine patch superfamily enzyme